jgi:hypothetical protein
MEAQPAQPSLSSHSSAGLSSPGFEKKKNAKTACEMDLAKILRSFAAAWV